MKPRPAANTGQPPRPDYTAGETLYHASVAGRRVASDTELRGLLDQLGQLFREETGR